MLYPCLPAPAYMPAPLLCTAGYQLPSSMPALFQPDGGVLDPEGCVKVSRVFFEKKTHLAESALNACFVFGWAKMSFDNNTFSFKKVIPMLVLCFR